MIKFQAAGGGTETNDSAIQVSSKSHWYLLPFCPKRHISRKALDLTLSDMLG